MLIRGREGRVGERTATKEAAATVEEGCEDALLLALTRGEGAQAGASEAGKRKESVPPQEPLEGVHADLTARLQCSKITASRTRRERICAALSHYVSDNLLQQQQETNSK